MDRDDKELIEATIREVKQHHDAGPYRIIAYYHEPEVTKFDTAPHDQQFQQAAGYIDYVLDEVGVPRGWDQDPDGKTIEQIRRRDWVKEKLEDLIYAIAMEVTVSAAHMKIDTKSYLSYLSTHNGLTPHVEESVKCVMDDLAEDLSGDAIEEIELTFELAKELRNNIAHFGFHYHGGHTFPYLFITVTGFLIERYADTDEIPELITMRNFCNDYKERQPDAAIYPELTVDFKPF